MTTKQPTTEMKKLLIITSSGGGGLIQTANAKTQEALAKDPNLIIVRIDLLKDWVWGPFGNFCINFWNNAQLKGNIFAQQVCVWGQSITDYCLHSTLYYYALQTLLKEDIDHVIDTQVLGTSAILKAIEEYNRRKNKKVRFEKIVVDLPTKRATHFFRSIKKLTKEQRKNFQLTSIAPVLEDGETEDEFWQDTCGFSASQVNIVDPYVRAAFIPYKKKIRSQENVALKFFYKNHEELALIQASLSRSHLKNSIAESHISFSVDPKDLLFTILLGSQPSKSATLRYVEKILHAARKAPDQKMVLCAFCADHKVGERSLLKSVTELVLSTENYPKNLSVIPFSFQSEEVIAPLFARSDATCTRSGGQTAMELMSVSTGQMWIHSEAAKGEDILKGMPSWESASAIYLQKGYGAKIVSVETIDAYLDQLMPQNLR